MDEAWDVMAHAEEEAIARGKEEFFVEPKLRPAPEKLLPQELRKQSAEQVDSNSSNENENDPVQEKRVENGHRQQQREHELEHETRRSRQRRRARSSGTVLVDASLRDAMQEATGWTARTPVQILAEFYQTDFEYAMVPNSVSWIGSATLRQKNLFGAHAAYCRGFFTIPSGLYS